MLWFFVKIFSFRSKVTTPKQKHFSSDLLKVGNFVFLIENIEITMMTFFNLENNCSYYQHKFLVLEPHSWEVWYGSLVDFTQNIRSGNKAVIFNPDIIFFVFVQTWQCSSIKSCNSSIGVLSQPKSVLVIEMSLKWFKYWPFSRTKMSPKLK